MLPNSVSNRLARDKNRVLQKSFCVECFLLCCKQRIEVVLLLGFFKHSGAINLGKGMNHENLLPFSSDVP